MYLWPLQLHKGILEKIVTNIHNSEITKIKTSCDKKYLITISKDCNIFLSYMKYFNERNIKSYKRDLVISNENQENASDESFDDNDMINDGNDTHLKD